MAIVTGEEPETPSEGSPPPFYETLQEFGRPATECPEAKDAYAALGVDVDVFIGPCPPPGEIVPPGGG